MIMETKDTRKAADMKFTLEISDPPKGAKGRDARLAHATIKFKHLVVGYISNGDVYLKIHVPENKRMVYDDTEWRNERLNMPRMGFKTACDYVLDHFEYLFYNFDLQAKVEIERAGGFIKPDIVEYL